MKIRFLYLNILALLSLPALQGQEIYELKDCISIGLERNFSILIARNSETISKNNFTLGNAGFLPTIDLNGRHSGTLNNTTQMAPKPYQTEYSIRPQMVQQLLE
jgi:outer membrane protein TolC